MVVDMNYWSKVIKRTVILALTIIAIYLGYRLAIFYIPFLMAFVLSMLIEPIIRFLMKKLKFKRRTSAIIVFTVVISIISAFIVWGVITLISEASNMLSGLNEYFEKAYIRNTKYNFKTRIK